MALNEQDLKARIQEDELRLKKLQFAHAISPLENPMSIRDPEQGDCPVENRIEEKNSERISCHGQRQQ